MARRPSAIMMLLLAAPALAQTPEQVTVTGTRSRQVMEQFIQNFAAPTRVAGKLARWAVGICPQVTGVKPEAAAFIVKRIRAVAEEAGAPLGGPDCRTNIQIVFTTAPQALLDDVRAQHPDYLGYADNSAAREAQGRVTRPIQGWYETATRDLHGQTEIDGQKTLGMTMTWPPPPPGNGGVGGAGPPMYNLELPNARRMNVTGTRMGDGLKSEFAHVTIVAEPAKLMDHELGALADYIALLSLTQLNTLEACQPLPSIVNLLAKDCAQQPAALSENDLAYLRGLYKMTPDASARSQTSQIGYQMEQSLEGK